MYLNEWKNNSQSRIILESQKRRINSHQKFIIKNKTTQDFYKR